ncbi:MAG: hypothetical protein WCD35_00610 [Mycobacteriales bacterium]
MTSTSRWSRRIRRQSNGEGLHLDVAADVNVVVAHGGTASARQETSITQGRKARKEEEKQ